MKIAHAMAATDWPLLAQQKLALIEAIGKLRDDDPVTMLLQGLLHFIDSVQDAAEIDGYPVVFLKGDK